MSACFCPKEMPDFCFFRGLLCSAELPGLVAIVCGARSGASARWSAISSDFLFVPRVGAIVKMILSFNAMLRQFRRYAIATGPNAGVECLDSTGRRRNTEMFYLSLVVTIDCGRCKQELGPLATTSGLAGVVTMGRDAVSATASPGACDGDGPAARQAELTDEWLGACNSNFDPLPILDQLPHPAHSYSFAKSCAFTSDRSVLIPGDLPISQPPHIPLPDFPSPASSSPTKQLRWSSKQW